MVLFSIHFKLEDFDKHFYRISCKHIKIVPILCSYSSRLLSIFFPFIYMTFCLSIVIEKAKSFKIKIKNKLGWAGPHARFPMNFPYEIWAMGFRNTLRIQFNLFTFCLIPLAKFQIWVWSDQSLLRYYTFIYISESSSVRGCLHLIQFE